jgi:catechol 2,3-dioxygenase-like lactoylglutathione lyase family enzyme
MTRPSLRVTSVTIGTAQPHDLAHFYADLLGWTVTAEDPPDPGDPVRGGWAQIRPPVGVVGPTLNFEYELHFSRPIWPSVPGEQTASQHLDIWVDDLDASVEWAVARGATLADFQPQDDVRVLIDPSGHPFCLFL